MNNILIRGIGLSCILLYLLGSGAVAEKKFSRHKKNCDSSVFLCSPKDVRKAFETTEPVTQSEGTFKIPALISDDIFIRAIRISDEYDPQGGNRDHVLNTYALNRAGIGRWFTFLGGSDLAGKALVAGQFNATKIFRDLGYGSEFECGTNDFYWLVVFRKTSETNIKNGVYKKNLQAWFKHVYGNYAPTLPRSELRRLESERFKKITGCPVDPNTGEFDPKDLNECDLNFSQAVEAFWTSSTCSDPNVLTYAPNAGCPTDKVLASYGKKLDAVQMRAYLYAVGGFNEYYTGYGYTANAYNDPISREYWTDNAWIEDLPEVELLNVHCTEPNAPVHGTNMREDSPYVTTY